MEAIASQAACMSKLLDSLQLNLAFVKGAAEVMYLSWKKKMDSNKKES